MELKETTKLMNSKKYKDRFKAEIYQLDIRIGKLANMLSAWDRGELGFTPSCSYVLLETQLDVAASAWAESECRQEEWENVGEVRKETDLGLTSHQPFLSSPSYSCSSRPFSSLWTRNKGRMKCKLLVGGHCSF